MRQALLSVTCAVGALAVVPRIEAQSNCWQCAQYPTQEWYCSSGHAFGGKSCHMSNGVCILTGQCPLTVLPGEISAAGTIARKAGDSKGSPREQRDPGFLLANLPRPILADSWRVDCKGRVVYRSMTFAAAERLRKVSKVLRV